VIVFAARACSGPAGPTQPTIQGPEAGLPDVAPPIDAAPESARARLEHQDPFELRSGLSIQAHPVTRGEYAQFIAATTPTTPSPAGSDADLPVELHVHADAMTLCAALDAHLPTEDECAAVVEAQPDAWVWGAKNPQKGLVFICNHASSPHYESPNAAVNGIGVICVR
jgi:formylglycine-generating enzyme required for sulfatase activity